jgi:ribosomal protein L20A (L18A)
MAASQTLLGLGVKSPRSVWLVSGRRTLKRFVHDFKGFAKEKKVATISKVVAEMASNFNLGVDEVDIEEFLEVVPEELINKEFLELKQEHIAEEEAREQRTTGEEKEHQKKNSQ